MQFKPCIIIPIYDNEGTIRGVVESLAYLNLPCLIVDDGSGAPTQQVLREWLARLSAEAADAFPVKVTAFREGMAVHGRYRKPCPDCGADVQRIVYASNETNYCARCQTGGKLLADRALSRLLKKDWPRTLEELEERRSG